MPAVGAVAGGHYVAVTALGAGDKELGTARGAEPFARFIGPAAVGTVDGMVCGIDLVLIFAEPADAGERGAMGAETRVRGHDGAAVVAGCPQSHSTLYAKAVSSSIFSTALAASNRLLHAHNI